MTEYSVEKFYNEYAIKKEAIIAVIDSGTNARKICDLLNEQEERIIDLKNTIIKITIAYQRKHDNTIVNLVDEVWEEDIGDLFIEWNHGDVE